MSKVPCLLLVALLSCNNAKQNVFLKNHSDSVMEQVDSAIKRADLSIKQHDSMWAKLDSSLYYFQMNHLYADSANYFAQKMKDANIEYLSTDDESMQAKWEKRFYRYRDLQWHYVDLTNKFYEKQQNNK